MLRSSLLSCKGLWEYFLLVFKAEQAKPDSNCDLNAQWCKTIMRIYFSLGMEGDDASVLFASLKLRRENVKWMGKRKVKKLIGAVRPMTLPPGQPHL
jgi:hypothetical protein